MSESADVAAAEPEVLEREAGRLVRELGIPPCPQILSRFAAEMRQEDPDVRTLAALIASDVALAAALLRTVNAPFYGLGAKVTGVQQALAVLGLRASGNLIAGLALRQVFPAAAGARMEGFWALSGALAATAVAVATHLRTLDRAEAHAYALFRECGMAPMIARFPDYDGGHDFAALAAGRRVTAGEEQRYRYSHARVGYALARSWMLPEHLCRAILHHHDFDLVLHGHRDLAARSRRLIAFGLLVQQLVALRQARGLCPEWPAMEGYVLEALAITPEQIVHLAETLPAAPA